MKPPATRFIWGFSVRAIIRDRHGRILLLRRHPASKYFAGAWELPGGKIDACESFDAALKREVCGETGLTVCLNHAVGLCELDLPGLRVVLLCFETQARSTRVRLSDEHTAFHWSPMEKLKSFQLSPDTKTFLEDFVLSHRRPMRRAIKP
jgi:8-oxo-dGTP diphosphatase